MWVCLHVSLHVCVRLWSCVCLQVAASAVCACVCRASLRVLVSRARAGARLALHVWAGCVSGCTRVSVWRLNVRATVCGCCCACAVVLCWGVVGRERVRLCVIVCDFV